MDIQRQGVVPFGKSITFAAIEIILTDMNYDVFISYSMSLSSRAYELSAQLGRENMMCYLDCMESGYTLGDYTRTILEESRLYVSLADTLPALPYATALLQCVIAMTKPMLVCLASGDALPDALSGRCTATTDAMVLEDILCLLLRENIAPILNTIPLW